MSRIKPWKVIESKRLVDHPFVRLGEDLLEHPDDGRRYKYYYLESRSHAVATVPITDQGKVVLVRQYRHPVNRIIYDLPAGRTSTGEDPMAAARRELKEETGYEAGEIYRLGFYNQFPGVIQAGTHLFLARKLVPGQQDLDEFEDLEVVEVPFFELLEQVANGEYIDGSLQLGVLLVQAKGLGPIRQ
jgi:ADP-ribose pyrophosphatase